MQGNPEEADADWTSRVRVGASSWSDRSLTQDADWYPRRTMKAAERMTFYASRFSLVEMETTYRFPPTPAITQQWVDRTPESFSFDVQAWSLLTGQATMRESLWEDLHREIRDERQDNPRLYETHLSSEAIDECWARFRHALDPIRSAGKLGTVILRYPRWFKPSDTNRDVLATVRERMIGFPLAIELASPHWVEPQECEATFDLLEALDISFICIDSADSNPRHRTSEATTANTGVVRLLGRRAHNDNEWTPDWRSYRYSEEELIDLLPRIRHLAESCNELHVLVGTCWQDDAVRNGELLQRLLGVTDLREPQQTSL